MTQSIHSGECPADALTSALAAMQRDTQAGLDHVEALLRRYRVDPRLHFLRGSLLAALQRYDEGRAAMAEALVINPDFAIARYQLGFLELTSGNPEAASIVWRPLQSLAPDNPLRVLADGLNHFAVDDFAVAIEKIERGMTLNVENPAINRDLQLLINAAREKLGSADAEPISSTHLLLQQYRAKPTQH